ncbi:MAG TPA: protein translocase subunit SecD [Gemmatimonadota bacterium]|nr:protein translocase subunit SecD [Gemmatimonadota bacterium]
MGLSILAAAWYLWPTMRYYSMSSEEREELRRNDPAAWDRLKEGAIQLGLDLQGGMHLVLELDESDRSFTGEEQSDAIDRALEIIRNRVDEFGVSEPLIQKVGNDRIIVELPGIQDEDRAKSLVQQAAYLEFQLVVDGQDAIDQIRAVDAALAGRAIRADTTSAVPPVAANADIVAASDTAAADTTTGRTLEELTGGGDTAGADTTGIGELTAGDRPLSSLLQTIPRGNDQNDFLVPENEAPNVEAMLADSVAVAALGPGFEWLWSGEAQTFSDGRSYKTLYLLHAEPLMTGEAVATASAAFDTQLTNQPIVSLDLTNEGAGQFGDVTRAHVNERLAIVLDEVVRMAPNINQAITTGRAQIEGFDSVEEARDIGIVLRAGALPAPLQIIEERTVGPSLGADSVRAGKVAGILGFFGVVAFMILYYRVSGLVADIALLLNVVLVLAALAAFGATLTLPGIAGLILTVGMAVDANVLVFERVREELEIGKTVRAAIDTGYDRALVAILDSQITTLIAGAVLFQFGTGPIKGFAVVLSIGIVSSIFTAVFVTRTIYDTWMRRSSATGLSI